MFPSAHVSFASATSGYPKCLLILQTLCATRFPNVAHLLLRDPGPQFPLPTSTPFLVVAIKMPPHSMIPDM